MPTITSLEAQQHDDERVNVFLDGTFAFGVSAMVAVARGLHSGQVLSEVEVESLLHDESLERAYDAALNFLSFRPRSRREIEDYFRRKKVAPEASAVVVERLERSGLLDDREFARYWLENRQTFRPRGSRALKAEMRQKGLASDVIDEALEEIGDEEAPAYEAGKKKLRSLQRLEEREFQRKMVAFLGRRGFEYGVCAKVAKRLWTELEEPTR
jgi:regulatory protein